MTRRFGVLAAVTALAAIVLAAPASADKARTQFTSCATPDGKQRAAVHFYWNAERYVTKIVYRLRFGRVSRENTVAYRERITDESGEQPFGSDAPGFYVRGYWETRNDGRWRTMTAKRGLGVSPWGWHRYMDTKLYYQPAVSFEFASGRKCIAFSQP